MFEVTYTKAAAKALIKAPADIRRAVIAKVKLLAADDTQGLDIKKLQGRAGFRLRVRGDWRVIYTRDGSKLTILILHIGPRGGAYK